MKSPTKRKKAGLICPVDEEPLKKTQAQIKREQREAADQKTKELLKNNPTYEQLAKALHKVLLNQETLIKRDEKLKAFEGYISLVGRFIEDSNASLFSRSIFITRGVNGYGEEDPIRQLILKTMDLKVESMAAEAVESRRKRARERIQKIRGLFEENLDWLKSKDSSSNLAHRMIDKLGTETVGSHDELQRNISTVSYTHLTLPTNREV